MPAEHIVMLLTVLLATGADPAAAPDAELLEFLGSFESRDSGGDGQWLDPMILDEDVGDAPPAARDENRS